MPRRKKLTPRKTPRQERAHATVEAILQASTYILIEDGWEGLTTNRVADRAGVNIASLYQYFPNKEAIVGELQRRHVAKARAGFPRQLPVARSRTELRAALRLLMEASVREHLEAPTLHRVFAEELPRSTRQPLPPDAELAQQWGRLLRPFVKHVPNLEMAGYVMRVATHAVIHEAAADRPQLLRDPQLVEELVTLMERYLVRPAPVQARQRRAKLPPVR